MIVFTFCHVLMRVLNARPDSKTTPILYKFADSGDKITFIRKLGLFYYDQYCTDRQRTIRRRLC
jgi:hypothetical protein